MPKLKIRSLNEGETPDYYWCPETGNDANPGTLAQPFQHRSYARDNISVGETVKKKNCCIPKIVSERIS